jgi:hypothetical protein
MLKKINVSTKGNSCMTIKADIVLQFMCIFRCSNFVHFKQEDTFWAAGSHMPPVLMQNVTEFPCSILICSTEFNSEL